MTQGRGEIPNEIRGNSTQRSDNVKKKKKKKPQSWFHKPEDKTSWFSRSMYAKEFYLDNGGKLATD